VGSNRNFSKREFEIAFLYWLLRGDIKFYLYSDAWKAQNWTNWFFENYSYLVAVPLVFIFALMLRPTRKISFVLICIVAMGVFVAVEEGRGFAVRQLGNMLAMRDFKCTFGHIEQVAKKYAPDLIARQIAYKINNDSFKANQFLAALSIDGAGLSVDGTNLVLEVKPKPEAKLTAAWLTLFSGIIHKDYCSNSNPYWVAIRRINYGLLLNVYDKDDRALILTQQFTPRDCWWGGSR
jgi:hypothetical protein